MSTFAINQVASAPLRLHAWDACRFAVARGSHDAIAPFRTPRALALRLAQTDLRTPARYRLARALVAVYQDEPCALWSELLLRAFTQLIAGVRAQVYLGPLEHGDVDQLATLKFLELARRVDLDEAGDWVGHVLARDLRRDLFRECTYERQATRRLAHGRVDRLGPRNPHVSPDTVEAGAVWSSLARGHDADRLAEHLVLARDGALRAHIYEVTPGTAIERKRAYDAAKDHLLNFVRDARKKLAADAGAGPPPKKVRKRYRRQKVSAASHVGDN